MALPRRPPFDLVRNLLVILIISLLILGSLCVMQPFLAALIWATMITVSTWPLMLKAQHHLRGSRGLAVFVMMLAMLLIIVVPIAAAVVTIADRANDIREWITAMPSYSLPAPPDWVSRIPLVGTKLATDWKDLSDAGPGGLLARAKPYAAQIAHWTISQAGSIGSLFLHLLLTTVIAGILFAQGDTAARAVVRFSRRISGDRGEVVVLLAGKAIRAVALGIIVTAVAQSALGGIGLLVTGVPLAGLLTALMLILCIAQLGPALPLLAGVAWLYWQGHHVAAFVLLAWTIVIGLMDNFLRPLLIKRGADLPLLLILVGVIGGLFAFGLVGLFVGPAVLAVTFTLLETWINEVPDAPLPPPEAPAP
ncbi:AI-2E family transporter YdiK [Dyella soli]|uniref:AI-2E family transporter YdiK n=1 Tax=Dyella soli TaxID=522319 RepID=A0A4R0YU58_9GAMM|nr:AI-2E family transporter YdiK [Dyella soli]TCI10368.1 AI-2E family transporter YdiK [Dyella soli]